MSDQGLSEENTPVVAGPDGTGAVEQAASGDESYQQRYVDLQREYTRSQQENAEMRRQQELYDLLISTEDADTRRRIAEQLGYQLEQEAEPQQFDGSDPYGYDRRLGALEQAQQQAQQAALTAQQEEQMLGVLNQRLEKLGLDEEDGNIVLSYAMHALPVTAEGLPDVEQAHQFLAARDDRRQKDWAKTKQSPRIPSTGQAATEVPNLDNREERVAWMTERLQDNQQA